MATSKKSILIVEDNEEYSEFLKEILENAGFKVVCAMDGYEGVQAAERHSPELVFLDIRMPTLNGYEVLGQLKVKKIETRVVMMSNVEFDIKSVVKCIKDGACDFLEKPFCVPEYMGIFPETAKRSLALERNINSHISMEFAKELESIVKENTSLKLENANLNQKVEILEGVKRRPVVTNGQVVFAVFVISGLLLHMATDRVHTIAYLASIGLVIFLIFGPWDRMLRIFAEGFGYKAGFEMKDESGDKARTLTNDHQDKPKSPTNA